MPHRLRVLARSAFLLASVITAAVAVGGAGAATRASAPVNGCPPSIEGQLVVGKTISAGNGCWSNNPTGFAYKWLRCNNQTTSSCVAVSSSRSITLQSFDVGHSFVVLVTATNSAGSTGPVNSKPSELVSAAAPPQVKTRPTVTGKAEVGQALAAKTGTFSGGIPRKLTFQWQTCDETGDELHERQWGHERDLRRPQRRRRQDDAGSRSPRRTTTAPTRRSPTARPR